MVAASKATVPTITDQASAMQLSQCAKNLAGALAELRTASQKVSGSRALSLWRHAYVPCVTLAPCDLPSGSGGVWPAGDRQRLVHGEEPGEGYPGEQSFSGGRPTQTAAWRNGESFSSWPTTAHHPEESRPACVCVCSAGQMLSRPGDQHQGGELGHRPAAE